MDQNFFFVDGMHANKASRRQMRRHVMKGKNAGKTLNRPSKPKRQNTQLTSNSSSIDKRSIGEDRSAPISMSGFGPLSNIFIPSWLPIGVTPESLKVIHECTNEKSRIILEHELSPSISLYLHL